MLEAQKDQQISDAKKKADELRRIIDSKMMRAHNSKVEMTKQHVVESVAYHMVKQQNLDFDRKRLSKIEMQHTARTR